MSFVYLLPVVLIGLGIGYTFWARSRAHGAVAAGHGPELFHAQFAEHFDGLQGGERVIAGFRGMAYSGSSSGAGRLAGAALNELSSSVVGLSSYTPLVVVALTSQGRTLVAVEHSDLGERDHWHDVKSFGPGALAKAGPDAVPGHRGGAPRFPLDPTARLTLTSIQGTDGSGYPCWLAAGYRIDGAQAALEDMLPISPEAAASAWDSAASAAVARSAAPTT